MYLVDLLSKILDVLLRYVTTMPVLYSTLVRSISEFVLNCTEGLSW
jgi:hypothetical protein